MSLQNLSPDKEYVIQQLEAIKRFLLLKNWIVLSMNESAIVFEGPVDDIGNPATLILPASAEFVDAERWVVKALNLLAAIEDIPVAELKEKILLTRSDFVRPRILTPDNQSSISLALAHQVIGGFYNLICDAACLEEEVQPFFSKRRGIGKVYAERCQFGQTFPGSYGLTIEMPIEASVAQESDEMPIERRIMMRIAHGLHNVNLAAQKRDGSLLLNDYQQGFNANLYETLFGLMQALGNWPIEFSFSWSPEYTVPKTEFYHHPIRLVPDRTLPFLNQAAQDLRRYAQLQDTLITGKIVHLRGDSNRDIDIKWEGNKGKSNLVRVTLSSEQYKLACDAHRDELLVSVRGQPEKRGKQIVLNHPVDFQIQL